ncbi:MAG: hypothetical protein GY749_33845 [Desulfobacteraceae bacterium]|nr:hypothetical protein [Desulfobacteraceae bacterium]
MGGGFPQGFVDALFMLFVYAVAGRWRWTGTGSGSRIVSVLGNSNGQIFGLGVNQRHMNITFHAETNLIQTLAGPIPAGSTLYSTLEPCFQCAGMIVKAGGTRCVYGQNDPNMTNNTALSNIDSGRHTAAMFRETFNLPRIDIGTKLDQITRRATIGAQAAAIGRTFQAQPPQPRGFKNVQQAVNATNYQHIRTRVLNILNAAPTLAVFRQADVVLETLVAGVRLTYQHGTRERIFMENIATVLNY